MVGNLENFQSRTAVCPDMNLKEKALDCGVDFDRLIAKFERNCPDLEIAEEFAVPEKTIAHLRRHFEKYGLNTLEDRDA